MNAHTCLLKGKTRTRYQYFADTKGQPLEELYDLPWCTADADTDTPASTYEHLKMAYSLLTAR